MSITVCIATKDRWNLLDKALNSVLNQDFISEVIVINDGSIEDESTSFLEILREYGSSIKYIKNQSSLGLAKCRNIAIRNCTNNIFTFLDDDDFWPDKYIHKNNIIELFNRNNDLKCIFIYPKNKILNLNEDIIINMKNVLKNQYIPPVGSQFYRIDLIREVGGYNEQIKSGVDHDLWINLLHTDCLCCLHYGYGAKGQSSLKANRLTTNKIERLKGINSALKIWKPSIINFLGESFFKKFKDSYKLHLNYKFLRKAIISWNISDFFQHLSFEVFVMLIKDLFLRIIGISPSKKFLK
ncbi:MAG: glycosyltransferase family A protein [Flavobacteriaceae bacterium]